MCPSESRARLSWPLAAVLILTAAGVGFAQEAESSAAPRLHARKSADGPLRLAVLMVRTNTPILVEAAVRFAEAHGDDKLVVEPWVQEDWAEAPRPLDFSSYDMILALRCSIPGHEKAVADAAKAGAWVVALSPDRYGGAATAIDDVPELAPYYRMRGTSNMVGLLEKACELYAVPGVTARAVKESPTSGVYHPDADRVFPDADAYLTWYTSRPGVRPDAPRVGILLYNTLYLNDETDYLTQLVREVERAGAIPILGFEGPAGVGSDETPRRARGGPGSAPGEPEPPSEVLVKLFHDADVLIASTFRLLAEKERHAQALKTLDVPVLNAMILSDSRETWWRSDRGVPTSYMLPGVAAPESSGLIDPVVVAARQEVASPRAELTYHRTVLIEENFRRLLRRALAWSKLRRTPPSDRRVAILYYNHAGGKQAVGASYLNVTESLACILDDLKGRGYAIEGDVDRPALVASLQAGGRNVGSWAPGEVERLVREGAVLWPLESYLALFDRLPEAARKAMVRQWGQPPGDVMTVTRNGARYFVLPAFVRGNVLCAPQPARQTAERKDAAYHDPHLWPTHQYLAFYLWLRHEWKADAVVHLGRHGTLEFLPGKGVGLSWEDPPALVLGDLPNINPYIVDGIGEGVAAKRRGGAVLVTHATPPIVETALYGPFAELRRKLDQKAQADRDGQKALADELSAAIHRAAEDLGFHAHPHEHDGAAHATEDEADAVSHWLETIESQRAPRGLHTFGSSYSEADVRRMIPKMFADEWEALDLPADEKERRLDAIARGEGASGDSDDPLARIATVARAMRRNGELDGLARTLDGRFLPAGPPGDPLSNPDVFPTGRNQHQTDSAKIPTREAWTIGRRMAEQTIALHVRKHGRAPERLGVTLWANTLIRSQGVLEAQTLALLGVEPVWNARGDVVDVNLSRSLGRPRVDVVMTLTGMYRDSFADKALLLDKAVRLAAEADDEPGLPNPVRIHSEALARELIGRGLKSDEARRLSRARVFGAEPGKYGAGLGRVSASDAWADRDDLAGDYLDRMGFAFTADAWAAPAADLFRSQLRGVEAIVHGRSSSLYGLLDLTEAFEYQGGMGLAVEHVGGKAPDLYVDDLVDGRRVDDARDAVRLELASRYHNPDFIRSMQAEGYDGARYLSRVADVQFGWDVVGDAVTAADWKEWADVYLADKHDLGLAEFFERDNPHALQSMAARILEVERKGLQDLDDATVELAADVYVASVASHGAACSSFICDGRELNALAARIATEAGRVDSETLERFRAAIQESSGTDVLQPIEGVVIARSTPPPSSPPQAPEKADGDGGDGPGSPKPAAPNPEPPASEPAAPGAAATTSDRGLAVAVAAGCVLAFLAGAVLRRGV